MPASNICLQNVHEFEDKEFANVSKEDLKLAGKDEQEKKREKKLKVRPGTGWRPHASAAPAVWPQSVGPNRPALAGPGSAHLAKRRSHTPLPPSRALRLRLIGTASHALLPCVATPHHPPPVSPHSINLPPTLDTGGVQATGQVVEGGAGQRR